MPKRKLSARDLAHLTDSELLATRMCDLPITLQGAAVTEHIDRLYSELAERDLKFRPHCWLSDEWCCHDGIPGIAIPFFLAHPRLERLERKQMLEAEGSGERECMKILRHEAGHAIDNAYRLHYRREWQRLFGSFADKYPRFYKPRPNSRNYVLHLNNWYAQAHPAEDFAETFAVWLTPNSRWRQNYELWPAIRKLEYVHKTCTDLAGVSAPNRKRTIVHPLSKIQRTLREHYAEKFSHYRKVRVDFYTRDLRRIFSDDHRFRMKRTAASFIREIRNELRITIGYLAGIDQYTVDQVLEGMTERSKELKLRLTASELQTRRDLTVLVTAITMNIIHSGRNRVAL